MRLQRTALNLCDRIRDRLYAAGRKEAAYRVGLVGNRFATGPCTCSYCRPPRPAGRRTAFHGGAPHPTPTHGEATQ